MSYENVINKIVTRKYHAYSDGETEALQGQYDAYLYASMAMEKHFKGQKDELDALFKEKKINEAEYEDKIAAIERAYSQDKDNVSLLQRQYEHSLNELKAKGYDIQVTSGIIYAVVQRYQPSPNTDKLNELYEEITAAKEEFSNLLIEKYKLSTLHGLNGFIESYVIQEQLYEASTVSQATSDLESALYTVNLGEAILQQKRLESLIENFNNEYNLLSANNGEFSNPRIIQDLDGKFYEDILSRDLQSEISDACINDDSKKILEKQLKDRALIEVIDRINIYANHSNPGINEFTIKVEVVGQVINWFIIGSMDQSTQEFRDVIYSTAAKAHAITNGCTGYYRGSDSLHVKRHHSREQDALFNHNHYRFETDVTPQMFREHMTAIIIQTFGGDILNNEHPVIGSERFLSISRRKAIIDRITDGFERYHEMYTLKRSPTEAIDLHNKYLIARSVGIFIAHAEKISSFKSVKSLNTKIDYFITQTLIRNGITAEMLNAYGPEPFARMIRSYKLSDGSSNDCLFDFPSYVEQYKSLTSACANPPRGYNHHDELLIQDSANQSQLTVSQCDVYKNCLERKLTPADENELILAKSHESTCANATHNSLRGFASFLASLSKTPKKANFTFAKTTLFGTKQHLYEPRLRTNHTSNVVIGL